MLHWTDDHKFTVMICDSTRTMDLGRSDGPTHTHTHTHTHTTTGELIWLTTDRQSTMLFLLYLWICMLLSNDMFFLWNSRENLSPCFYCIQLYLINLSLWKTISDSLASEECWKRLCSVRSEDLKKKKQKNNLLMTSIKQPVWSFWSYDVVLIRSVSSFFPSTLSEIKCLFSTMTFPWLRANF